METFIVAIDSIRSINNFNHLPTTFECDHLDVPFRVVMHNDPKTEVIGSKLVSNYDLLIKPNHYDDPKIQDSRVPFDSDKTILLPRFTKIEQALRLNELKKELKLTKMQPLSIWISNKEIGNWACKGMPDLGYVIKCNDGARGIGQVFVKDNIPLSNLLYVILDESTNSQMLRDRFPGVVYNTDSENDDNEGLRMLRAQGFHVCEYIPNIASEFRLTILNNDVVLAVKRTIKHSDGYKQATGVSDVRSHVWWKTDDCQYSTALAPYLSEIRKVIPYLKTPIGSCDIFITENGKWGMFEYCNQFGTDAYSPNDMDILHRKFIVNALTSRYPDRLTKK